jgi:hypothetical protein
MTGARTGAVTRAARAAAVAGMLLAGACTGGAAPPPAVPFVRVDAQAPERAPRPQPFVDDPIEPIQPSGEEVNIRLVADAKRQAQVFWGRKLLGVAPLEVKRPRGSGPLDLLVTAPGCLPLHTRVFTDRDETLVLRLYTERDAAGLLGYSPPQKPLERE